MMLGARTAAWAKSGYTAKDYVQDGLVAMWDGIENAGWGTHDDTLSFPLELINETDMTVVGSAENGKDYFRMKTGKYAYGTIDSLGRNVTVETVLKLNSYVLDMAFIDWRESSSSAYSFLHGYSWQGVIDLRLIRNGKVYSNAGAYGDMTDFCSFAAIASSDSTKLYRNGSVSSDRPGDFVNDNLSFFRINFYRTSQPDVTYNSIRVYNRELTAAEIAANYAIDKARFNLP